MAKTTTKKEGINQINENKLVKETPEQHLLPSKRVIANILNYSKSYSVYQKANLLANQLLLSADLTAKGRFNRKGREGGAKNAKFFTAKANKDLTAKDAKFFYH